MVILACSWLAVLAVWFVWPPAQGTEAYDYLLPALTIASAVLGLAGVAGLIGLVAAVKEKLPSVVRCSVLTNAVIAVGIVALFLALFAVNPFVAEDAALPVMCLAGIVPCVLNAAIIHILWKYRSK